MRQFDKAKEILSHYKWAKLIFGRLKAENKEEKGNGRNCRMISIKDNKKRDENVIIN